MGGTTKVKIQEKLRQKSVVQKEKKFEKNVEEFKKKEEKVVENFRIKVKEDKRKTSSKNENSKNEVEVKKSANIFKNWIEKAQDLDKSKKRSVFGDKSGAKRRRDQKPGEDRPSPSKVLKTDPKWTQKLNFDVKSDYHSTPNVPATSPPTSLSLQVYRCVCSQIMTDIVFAFKLVIDCMIILIGKIYC